MEFLKSEQNSSPLTEVGLYRQRLSADYRRVSPPTAHNIERPRCLPPSGKMLLQHKQRFLPRPGLEWELQVLRLLQSLCIVVQEYVPEELVAALHSTIQRLDLLDQSVRDFLRDLIISNRSYMGKNLDSRLSSFVEQLSSIKQ